MRLYINSFPNSNISMHSILLKNQPIMASFSSQFAVFSLVFASAFASSWMDISADYADLMPKLLVPETVTADGLNENFRRLNDQLSGNLQGGVSLTVRQYNPGGIDPPNISPYSAELLLVLEGTLEVGFIDTKNKLHKNTLQAGDMFVFPIGLVHFKSNPSNTSGARTVAVCGGYTGSAYLPPILLSSGFNDDILAQSFKTDRDTIHKLKAGRGSHT